METTVSPVVVPTDHAHRWRIEEPNGASGSGVCRICGINKEFKNWIPETDFITNAEFRLAA